MVTMSSPRTPSTHCPPWEHQTNAIVKGNINTWETQVTNYCEIDGAIYLNFEWDLMFVPRWRSNRSSFSYISHRVATLGVHKI